MRDEDQVIEDLAELVLAGNAEATRARAARAGVYVHELLGTLVRACIVPSPGKMLVSADFASIEARAVLWLAADTAGLEVFRAADRNEGPDAYRVQASQLLNIEPMKLTKLQRQLGKSLVLGCGFGMGASRFAEQAELDGVDWSALPITPIIAVEGWRDAHLSVAGVRTGDESVDGTQFRSGGVWKGLEAAAMTAAEGTASELHGLRWEQRGADVTCRLPSGRLLVYPHARIVDAQTRRGGTRRTFEYSHRGRRVPTFGAKLTENVVQAICRDLLAEAIIRLERAGFSTVLHVHDEWVGEVDAAEAPAARDAIAAMMEIAPAWATGFPIKVEATLMRRYRK